MKTEWKTLISRRLHDEASVMGCAQIDVCSVCQVKSRQGMICAAIIADERIYIVEGDSENEMAQNLRESIAADRGDLNHIFIKF